MKKGIAASRGYAIGKVAIKEHEEVVIVERKIESIEEEKARLQDAIQGSSFKK